MQVPASLVVTREFVDFVEVRARVKQEEFIGISTHKVTKVRSSLQSGVSQLCVFVCVRCCKHVSPLKNCLPRMKVRVLQRSFLPKVGALLVTLLGSSGSCCLVFDGQLDRSVCVAGYVLHWDKCGIWFHLSRDVACNSSAIVLQ